MLYGVLAGPIYREGELNRPREAKAVSMAF